MGITIEHTMPLGDQWPTLDPFLFCAHHRDYYPPGNEDLAPTASLAGRKLGMDFDGIDGWNMYHGQVVPGFPQHPHRGFETISFLKQGIIDHSDSLGAAARFGKGDVQWMTAGQGIVHSEMFPLLSQDSKNPLELFQIWLNLPSAAKLVEPYFSMMWSEHIPHVMTEATSDRSVEISVIAGTFGTATALPPPPDSWAARLESDIAIWYLQFQPGAEVSLPRADGPETIRTLYVFEGPGLQIDDDAIGPSTGAVIPCDRDLALRAPDEGGDVGCLILQGRPIGEPVAKYGPFVMNDQAGIEQTFADYRRTGFGGWPWQSDGPVHAAHKTRFAHHADGRFEEAPATDSG